jgi:hypothetical protein
MTDDPQEAARRSLDPDRLLPGENPHSLEPDDAAHWFQVYGELVATKRTLAADLAAALEHTGEAASAELRSVDMVLIRHQLERFERRVKYWHVRVGELNGSRPRG